MDIRQIVHITLADQAPKIIDGYWHEWVDGKWINTGVKAEGEDGKDGTDGEDGKDGKDGKTPIKGSDYFDGKDGQNGKSEYIHVMYSNSSNGSEFNASPTNKKYIGVAVSDSSTPPTLANKYNWTLIKGTDGVKGEKGSDGESRYLHIKYSNNGTSFTSNNGETLGSWIGMYVDAIEGDSDVFSDYKWRKVDGEDGKDGKDGKTPIKGSDYFDGKDGQNGKSEYIHVMYSNSSNGSEFNASPTNKKYIGVAVSDSSTPPTLANKYNWTLIKGTDGVKGEKGSDGESRYLHIKYSNNGTSFTSNNGETLGSWIGMYVDAIEGDSDVFSDYKWRKVDGEDGKDGTNYLIMGFFSDKVQYKLSPAGIPVVKRPDGTQGNFSVFELIAPQSTFDLTTNKGTFVPSEWKLVESAEFIYMQDAYIERLQAVLVTAERIEALNIVTSRLEVTDGAKIGGLEISGDMLVSQNGRVVVDGVNNAIYLLDENGSIKTALRPDDLPALSSYFSNAVSREIAVAPIAGNYLESSPTRSSTSVALPPGSYEAIIPAMTLKAFATSTSLLGGGVSMRVELVSDNGFLAIGTVYAWASGANSDSQSRFIPKRTIALNKGGSYYLKATLTNDSIGGSYASGSGEVIVSNNLAINQVVNRSEIGNNGMMIATSKTRYDYMVGGTSEVRRGDYILKVTEDGIQKSSNGGVAGLLFSKIINKHKQHNGKN